MLIQKIDPKIEFIPKTRKHKELNKKSEKMT